MYRQAVMSEHVQLTPTGVLGDGVAAALHPYVMRYHTAGVMYSHASFYEHRLHSATAPSQLKVDGSIGQNHPLTPQPAPLKESDGRQ